MQRGFSPGDNPLTSARSLFMIRSKGKLGTRRQGGENMRDELKEELKDLGERLEKLRGYL